MAKMQMQGADENQQSFAAESIQCSIYNRLLLNILYVINQKYGLNL